MKKKHFEEIRGNHSFTNELVETFTKSQYHYNEPSVIALTALYVAVIVFGLMGNVLLLWWIRQERKKYRTKKLFDALVFNLCISDIFVLSTCCPFSIYAKITTIWHFGPFFCTFIHYIQGVSVTSNTLSMTALSVSRFLFVRRSFSYKKQRFYRLIVTLLFITWITSFVIPIPIIAIRKLKSFHLYQKTFEFCLEDWITDIYRKVYAALFFAFIYLMPCLILIYCHSSITIALSEIRVMQQKNLFNRNESRKQAFRIKTPKSEEENENSINSITAAIALNSSTEKTGRRYVKSQKNLSRFLIGTTVCFVLCWLPYNLASFYIDLTESQIVLNALPFTLLLGHAYSAIDPIVYWYLVKHERKKRKECVYLRSYLLHSSRLPKNQDSNEKRNSTNKSVKTSELLEIDTSLSPFPANTECDFKSPN
ncbi:orexin receptor type 2-like protein [Dinothrombium tinctorium]|uniref:Orexin receptor type 2-like protein n=1 Tax=Dinothrombium tinctorium TaxID=1965070 RepID=A0A443RQ75_9ACAR|nr:orexin receptor type 2-like protein [Dinothrombium tinctorium]